MTKKIPRALLTLLALSLTSAYADQSGWQYQPGSEDSNQITALSMNQDYAFRFPVFEDDITPDQDVSKVVLTPAQTHQAAVWGLSPLEEARYTLLMQNRSGTYYTAANITATPVDVLGINARTDTERQHFAELSAFQDAVKHAKELSYQTAYDTATKKLAATYNLQPVRPFDVSPFSPYKNKPINLQPDDKLMFYVKPGDNTVEISGELLKLMKSQPGVQMNVYFLNAQTSDAVTWAKANNIPQNLVSTGTITLNTNFSAPNVSTTPTLYLVRSGQSRVVDLSRF